jgi:hypothetical protein
MRLTVLAVWTRYLQMRCDPRRRCGWACHGPCVRVCVCARAHVCVCACERVRACVHACERERERNPSADGQTRGQAPLDALRPPPLTTPSNSPALHPPTPTHTPSSPPPPFTLFPNSRSAASATILHLSAGPPTPPADAPRAAGDAPRRGSSLFIVDLPAAGREYSGPGRAGRAAAGDEGSAGRRALFALRRVVGRRAAGAPAGRLPVRESKVPPGRGGGVVTRMAW